MTDYCKKFTGSEKLIDNIPGDDLGVVIVIPAYKEEGILNTLACLHRCVLPEDSVEVIVIINEPENSSTDVGEINMCAYKQLSDWCAQHSDSKLKFHVFYYVLPVKDAGVGLARKIGMDEAARRFKLINKSKDGIIVCFDADSLCDENYLVSIEQHFRQYPKTPGASIYFEHPLSRADFTTHGAVTYQSGIYGGIIRYELFLRYYVNALRYAGHPYAFQTIGSSMAVRSAIYTTQGGMNKRKAGEDFYFLQKIIPLGDFTEINTTRVIPSPRSSDRVPFGTGRAIGNWLATNTYTTYDFRTFTDLKCFLGSIEKLYVYEDIQNIYDEYPESIKHFPGLNNFESVVEEIRKNTSTLNSFKKRFLRWFDCFRVLKYIHFARDNFYPEKPVLEACKPFFENVLGISSGIENEKEMLLFLRKIDKNGQVLKIHL